MTKKIGIAVLVLVVIIVGIAGYLWQRTTPQMQEPQTAATAEPAIVGALVETNDARTSITIASQTGDKKTFSVSKNTQFISLVPAGQSGVSLAQVQIGQNLSVVADANNPLVATRIELLPPATTTASSAQAVTLTGAFVSATKNSITIAENNPPLPPIQISVSLTGSTQVLSEVVANDTGKQLSALNPGTKITITTTGTAPPYTAAMVEILLPQQ